VKLKDITREFYQYLYPDMEEIKNTPDVPYDTNSILVRDILIFGNRATGKTEMVRKIVEVGVEKYGEKNVNAVGIEEGCLDDLYYSVDKRLVQILFLDDFTLQNVGKEELRRFFRLRNEWYSMSKRKYGLLISIISSHTFYGMAKDLRTIASAFVFKSSTSNKYDRDCIRQQIGEDGLSYLDALDVARSKDKNVGSLSIVKFLHAKIGVLYTPLARKNYLRKPTSVSEYLNIKI